MNRSPINTEPEPRAARVSFDAAYPQVYGYLFRRCGQHELCEDVAAATFVAALASDRADAWPLPWLLVIARNKLVDHWRRAGRARAGNERLKSRVVPSGLSETDQTDQQLDIATAMASLAPDHQAVIALRHIDDLSVAECALLLGRSIDATDSLLRRAQAAFRSHWNEQTTEGDR